MDGLRVMDELRARRIRKAVAVVQLEEAEVALAVADVLFERRLRNFVGLRAERVRAKLRQRRAEWAKVVAGRRGYFES